MGALSELLGERVERAVRLPRVDARLRDLAARCDPGAVVVDLGCGSRSPVGRLVSGLTTIGVDADAPALAGAERDGTHCEFVQADLVEGFDAIERSLAGRDVQLVVALHVIEHLPKRLGFEFLERAEALTSRFVCVETPNGFQPQGPEYGNPGQRHLSGWFANDFAGLGYDVRGTAGTRYLRGYAGSPWLRFRGGQSVDFLAARLLWIERFPHHAYSLEAVKDVRGVAARLG